MNTEQIWTRPSYWVTSCWGMTSGRFPRRGYDPWVEESFPTPDLNLKRLPTLAALQKHLLSAFTSKKKPFLSQAFGAVMLGQVLWHCHPSWFYWSVSVSSSWHQDWYRPISRYNVCSFIVSGTSNWAAFPNLKSRGLGQQLHASWSWGVFQHKTTEGVVMEASLQSAPTQPCP